MSQRFNRKNILLVHPLGYPKSNAGKDISRIANIMPPIGLASIAAYLERRGISSAIVDCFARPDSDRIIRDYIVSEKPSFIGVSCTTSSFHDGIRIAALAKSILPGIRTIFGGAHVSALKDKLLRAYSEIDFSVIGEGEQIAAEIIKSGGEHVDGIPGLVYRTTSGDPVFTGFPKKGLELDRLPFPAYEKLVGFPDAYRLPIFNYPKSPNTSCISSRGCPYACTYCDRSVYRRTFRYNSATYMTAHLRYLKECFGIRHVNFYDDLFTFKRERVEEFCIKLIDRPLNMTFNCAARVEHIDAELLRLMKRAGCWMISIGIESGDERLLAQHRSTADLDMIAERIRWIKNAGIRVKGLLMMGLPGETEQSIRKSMEYVFSLKLDDFNLSKFTPFPGSHLYKIIEQYGVFNEIWEKMDCLHFLFIPSGMKESQMEKLFIDFYRKHYMQIRICCNYISMLWKSPDSWRRFIRNFPSFLNFALLSQSRFSNTLKPMVVLNR